MFVNVAAFCLLLLAMAVVLASLYAETPRDGVFIAKAIGFAVVVGASIWLLVTAAIRRLHDFNRSGLWLLTALVPAVNLLLFAALIIWPGSRSQNQFGAPARHNGLMTWLVFFLVVLAPIGLVPAGWILYDTHINT